jgi:DNA-binding NarL/FixJ family response regulator
MSQKRSESARIIKVAVIEDDRVTGNALAELIDATPSFNCCGLFRSAEAAIQAVDRCAPEVALVDLGLPGISGIDAIQALKQLRPSLSLLVLTVFDDETRIFEALSSGAVGYLLKKTPPAKIMQGIAETASGGAVMSPAVAKKVIRLFQNYMPTKPVTFGLTAQESRVLKLLVEGHSYATAARELGISLNTLATHIKRVYDKLHVHSKSEAVAKAIRSQIF